MSFGYSKITLDTAGVYLDGQQIDGMKIAPGITVNHGGNPAHNPSITLTIYADEIELTDAVKAFAKEHGTPIIEIHGNPEADEA